MNSAAMMNPEMVDIEAVAIEATDVEIVDVAFALRGETIPADHGGKLYRLLADRLPWLETEPHAGVHSIRGARIGADVLHVGGRGRLMLRLPRERAEAAFALSGTRLALGDGIELGEPRLRALFAHGTLYSPRVTLDAEDEHAFQRRLAEALRQAGIGCETVCGHGSRSENEAESGAARPIAGFSVLLHGLNAAQSLAMQARGLGAARKLGWGLFVPHRSAAAVGS